MEKVTVSIIVPVYNVEKYLVQCLDSLVNQSLSNIEILLIDDGSTDRSGKICKEYTKRQGVKYFYQKNSGQSVARNLGLKYATGEYVLFVDSDDYISLDACEVLYTHAKHYDVDIVVGDLLNEADKIKNNLKFRKIPSENKVLTVSQYCLEALEYNIYDIVPWIRLVRREFLINNNIRFIENCFYEDQDYSMQIFTEKNGKIIKIRFPFYYYRLNREGSTTNKADKRKAKDFMKVIRIMDERLNSLSGLEKINGIAILGLAYYHYLSLWINLDGKNLKELFNEFTDYSRVSTHYRSGLNSLNYEMKSKIKKIIKYKYLYVFAYRVKKYIKFKTQRGNV